MRGRERGFGDDEGAAYVEFVIVVMPFLVLFLGLTQLALVYGAQLLVEHAAAKAARAAVVILPDDHEEADYAGVPVNTVGGSGGEGLSAYSQAPAGGRLDAIANAARYVLAPVSPSLESLGTDSLAGALGESVGASVVAGLLGWTRWAVAVTFPDGEGGYRTEFGARGEVTARVTFLYRCSVPLARRIMCGEWNEIAKDRRSALHTNGYLLESVAQISGWRLIALEAERTLPNQGR